MPVFLFNQQNKLLPVGRSLLQPRMHMTTLRVNWSLRRSGRAYLHLDSDTFIRLQGEIHSGYQVVNSRRHAVW